MIKSLDECRVIGTVSLALMLQGALAQGPTRADSIGGSGGGGGRTGTAGSSAEQAAAGPGNVCATRNSPGEG